jgi:hypothetical protein
VSCRSIPFAVAREGAVGRAVRAGNAGHYLIRQQRGHPHRQIGAGGGLPPMATVVRRGRRAGGRLPFGTT